MLTVGAARRVRGPATRRGRWRLRRHRPHAAVIGAIVSVVVPGAAVLARPGVVVVGAAGAAVLARPGVVVVAVVVPVLEREVAGTLVGRAVVVAERPHLRTGSRRDPGRACRRRRPNRPRRWASPSPRRSTWSIPTRPTRSGWASRWRSAMVPPMTRPPTTSSATTVISFRTIDVIRAPPSCLSISHPRSPWDHRREGLVTRRPEGGKGLGKPQSSSDPDRNPELPSRTNRNPSLEEPEPELSSPAWVVRRRRRTHRGRRPRGRASTDRSPSRGWGSAIVDRDG